jgi:hypothetical protein
MLLSPAVRPILRLLNHKKEMTTPRISAISTSTMATMVGVLGSGLFIDLPVRYKVRNQSAL